MKHENSDHQPRRLCCRNVQHPPNLFGADNVCSACVTPEGGTNDMMEVARRYLEEWGEEQVVICSDLKCGSANQTAYPLIARPNTFWLPG